ALRAFPDAKAKASVALDHGRNNKRPRYSPSSDSVSPSSSGGTFRGSSGSSPSASKLYCRYCHTRGHMKDDCMKLKAKEASTSKSDTPAPAAVPSFSGPASNRGSFYKSKPAKVNQVKRTRL
ncbi:hypothetical protein DFQ27_002353, partial [Actinomortierella ambigua]